MAVADTNSIIKAHLDTCETLTGLVTNGVTIQIYCPRLPENVDLSIKPAVSFFTRGGTSMPYIPGIPEPSVQFDCWGSSPQAARQVYRALYDNLQGIQNVYVGNLVLGTDGITYRCILMHTSAVASKPITGEDYATYWVGTDGAVTGSTWVTATAYTLTYQIMSAIEEVQGQDLQDEVPGYFRVLTFFKVMVRAE